MSFIYIYEEICLFVFYLKHTTSVHGGELWGKQYVRESLVLHNIRELRGNRIVGLLRVDMRRAENQGRELEKEEDKFYLLHNFFEL